MRIFVFTASLLAALVIAHVAQAANGTLLVTSKTSVSGVTVREVPLQMDSADACQSVKVSQQAWYDSLTALGWPYKASVECL